MAAFISGVPPITAIGAGRLVRALVDQGADIVWVGNKSAIAEKVRNREPIGALRAALVHLARRFRRNRLLNDRHFIRSESPIVLLHPAEIGMDWCIRFIRNRERPTWIYLFDSSFFCVRSYNHLRNSTCIECLGGTFSAARKNGCKPYPIPDRNAIEHLEEIRALSRSGKLRFLAQSETQAKLAQRHFGENSVVRVAGMWTDDVEKAIASPTTSADEKNIVYDVVFHGSAIGPKGAFWALELASRVPALRFLFPFAPESLSSVRIPSNADFNPMSWDNGLEAAIANARLTLVPSLWSASIEAALVKSILIARRVAVIHDETAYSSEVPADLIVKLPYGIEEAAKLLAAAIKENASISRNAREIWRRSFAERNRRLLANIVRETRI